jgi:hypothetical protein
MHKYPHTPANPPTGHSSIPYAADSNDLGGSDSAFVLAVGGSAIATGDNTLATGTIHADVRDLGRVTEAVGYASFAAAAESNSGASGEVAADTFADVTGADFALVITRQSGPTAGSGTILSTSQTKVIAIDIAGWTPPGGPIEADFTIQTGLHRSPGLADGDHVTLLGHLATISADASAPGGDALATTNTFALTDALDPHNAFSFVSGLAISGIA